MIFPRLAGRPDFEVSVALLGVVVLFALSGLALEGNWPKLLRVGTAFAAYATAIMPGRRHGEPPRLSRFVLAGAAAGLISGLLRPQPMPPLFIAAQTIGAAALLGPAHWLALRFRRQ